MLVDGYGRGDGGLLNNQHRADLRWEMSRPHLPPMARLAPPSASSAPERAHRMLQSWRWGRGHAGGGMAVALTTTSTHLLANLVFLPIASRWRADRGTHRAHVGDPRRRALPEGPHPRGVVWPSQAYLRPGAGHPSARARRGDGGAVSLRRPRLRPPRATTSARLGTEPGDMMTLLSASSCHRLGSAVDLPATGGGAFPGSALESAPPPSEAAHPRRMKAQLMPSSRPCPAMELEERPWPWLILRTRLLRTGQGRG